jgi:type IV pilus assembly protein PilQ
MKSKKAIVFLLTVMFVLINNPISYSQYAIDPVTDSEGISQHGNVTLIFKDADIRTVLHTLSYKSGVNIVASSDVEGTVTIRLVDVPWETALEVILKNHGLASERIGNIIRVITLSSVAEEELQNEVFILNYAKSKEIAEAIEATITARGSIKYDDRTNTLIVTDIPTNLYKIKTVVSRLDRRTPQVAIEARLIETTLAKDENLGIDWQLKVAARGSRVPTTFPFTRNFSNIPSSIRDRYMPMLEPELAPYRFEQERSQTELRTYRLEQEKWTDPDTLKPELVDLEYKEVISSPSLRDLEYKKLMDFARFPYADVASFSFGTLDFTELSAVLEILNARADTRIISKPTITTLNNKEAKVHVGEDYYIPQYTMNDQTGRWEVTGYDKQSIGVVLEVIPSINDAGDIVVDLKPEVSAFLGNQDMGGGISLPVFSKRNAQTHIMIKNNQTIAMGGLMKETARQYENKVPILGDIPLIGNLFKKTEDGVTTTELLIFLTVRIIGEDEDDRVIMEETEAKTIGTKKAEKPST